VHDLGPPYEPESYISAESSEAAPVGSARRYGPSLEGSKELLSVAACEYIRAMGTADFDAFVRREQAAAAGSKLNWAKDRDEWLEYLDNLYETTESFLSEYIKRGDITIDYREIDLNEENIGAYKARQMILRVGRQEIRMTPVGTLLFGMKGRVDVVGRAGRTRLALVDSKSSAPKVKVTISIAGTSGPPAPKPAPQEIHWAWKIATSPPTVRYIELTRESLLQALMEVANG
jgi:hypothetical protein